MNRIKIPFTLLVVSLLLVQSVAWITSPRTVQAAPPLQTCSAEQTRATERWWFFGSSATIDFGTSGTTATAQSPASFAFGEGSTVVTDTIGQLLFYSDGQEVYDANHQVMPNGSGLLGDSSATQTVAAFPAVGQPGVYFVVANSTDAHAGPPNNQLYYSIVDMSLNGGLGDVTATKNVPLGDPSSASEALTAVPNDDGTGFWVVTYTNNSQNFLAYEFDANGPVTGSAITSTLPSSNYDGWGTLNLSPDLSQIVLLSGDHDGTTTGNTYPSKAALLDFDATTGQATQQFEWELPTGAGTGNRGYSADFSPDGNYIYATKIFGAPGQLYRYDIANNNTGPTVQASEEQLGSIGVSGGQVKRGPDGRMYVANNGGGTISVVNDPDNPVNPDYAVGGFALAGGSTSSFGLPQMATGCPVPIPVYEPIKSSNPASGAIVAPGEKITYTITLHNISGEQENGLTFADDLSEVVDDATYNNDVTSSTGTVTFNAPDEIVWQGNLGATETATITYSVTIKDDAQPGASLRNVIVGPVSTCYSGENDGCSTQHTVGSAALANTGQNPLPWITGALTAIAAAIGFYVRLRRNDKQRVYS